jgi:integrase
MASVAKPHKKGGNYRAIYTDQHGKRKFVAGTQNRKETLAIAQKLEDDHRQVRLGYRDTPSSARKHRGRDITEVFGEYQDWGESQGGRGGRPWSKAHANNRHRLLAWWKDEMGLESLADLEGVLPRVEKALRLLERKGRAGKTLRNYAEALGAFCDWCVDRGYLENDPLRALAPFDITPIKRRRVLTGEEIRNLLASTPDQTSLLYETALCSGLRANELRSLTVGHLDTDRCGLHLDAGWTKNRKPGFQPLPRALVQRLNEYAATGDARRQYEKSFKKAKAKQPLPQAPLLYVPSQPDRRLKIDLEAVAIPIETVKGKLDFHALRTTYVNLVVDSGVNLRDAQALARHSTPEMTLNVYGRPREDRMAEAVEQMAVNMRYEKKCAISVQRLAVGAERENATSDFSGSCVSQRLVAGAGFEPATFGL